MTSPTLPPLPYGRQTIEEDDIAAVCACLRGDTLTGGPLADRFEREFARVVGARHAVVCSSGTAALHLACMTARLGPGDAAIVPAVTFVATANAVRLTGAEVVFADVDPQTALMQPAHLEAALARAAKGGYRARAVLPVHLAGQVADMVAIRAIAERSGLVVIEDACHALGAIAPGGPSAHPVGGCVHSSLTVFSFHPVKAITMGEGGIVTTNNETLAAELKRTRNHSVTREAAAFERPDLAVEPDGRAKPWYHEFQSPGHNYRASDLNCALGLSQLRKLTRFIDQRRRLAARYDDAIARIGGPVAAMPKAAGRSACHLFVVLIDFASVGTSRAAVMEALARRGIATQVHYIPLPWQPYYQRRYGGGDFPGATAYYSKCLSLPLFPAMSEEDVDRVSAVLADVLGAA